VDATIIHDGQGVKISPIFFKGGCGVSIVGWKYGLIGVFLVDAGYAGA
jgi:hypothetical protein